jgi:hypothetical protein
MKTDMWGYIPLPWYVCYEFVRQICAGFVVAFGGPLRAAAAHALPRLSPPATRYSALLARTATGA